MLEIKEIPNDCCCQIFDDDSYIGLWCSKTHRVVVDGKGLGFEPSRESVLAHLKLVDSPTWTLMKEQSIEEFAERYKK